MSLQDEIDGWEKIGDEAVLLGEAAQPVESTQHIAQQGQHAIKTCSTCLEFSAGCEHPVLNRLGCNKWVGTF